MDPLIIAASRPDRFIYLAMGMLLVLFVCLSLHGVGIYHFSADEMMHIDIARGKTLREVLRFSIYEPHPPLGHILRHFWIAVSEAAAFVRGQSLLFGVLTVLLMYRMGTLLDGPWLGFLVAAVAAFSPSLILQSYIVRNYAFFTFFVTLTVFYYLHWRGERGRAYVLPFAIAGILTCLTHLSGMFVLTALGAYEVLRTRGHKNQLRLLVPYIAANGVIGLIAVAVWYMLLPKGIAPFQDYARGLTDIHWQLALAYPQRVFGFLLPFPFSGQYEPYLLLGMAFALAVAGYKHAPLRSLLWLLLLGLLIGVVLRGGDFYPFMEPRHVLWLLPFVAICCGWFLFLGYGWLQRRLAVPLPLLALLTLFAGWALQTPEKRFRQIFEYQITESQWQELVHYLSNLDARHLIVARRADVLLIDPPSQNPYRSMGQETITVTVPYHATRILFDPTRAHSWHYLDDLPLHMIREARVRGELDGVEMLVFVNTSWTSRISRHMVELMLCPSFPKTIKRIPGMTSTESLSDPGIAYRTPATLMIVPKHVFLQMVLPKDGAARACFS